MSRIRWPAPATQGRKLHGSSSHSPAGPRGRGRAARGGRPGPAATISGLSIVKNAGNTADSGSGGVAVASTTQILSSSATGFQARYAANVAADVGAFASTQGITLNANYTITFSVTHASGVNYQIDIGSAIAGALTYIDDAAGAAGNGTTADLTIGNVAGSRTGGGSLTGSLGMTNTASLVGGSSTSGVNQAISGSSAATIFAVGTGAPQLYTLTYTWSATARSTCSGLCVSGGDEKAVRLGAPGFADSGAFLANTTADNYPGVGNRTQANDGHFITVTVTPEPGTGLLFGLGLAGLGWAGRRRS